MLAARVEPELRDLFAELSKKVRRTQSDTLRLTVERVLADGVDAAAVKLNAFASGAREEPKKASVTAERFMELLMQAAEETGYVIVPPEKSGKAKRSPKGKATQPNRA